MTYQISATDNGPMRHNDGSMVILKTDGDDIDVVLLVPMTIRAKRGEAWKTSDPAQEAFAAHVVALLNGDA